MTKTIFLGALALLTLAGCDQQTGTQQNSATETQASSEMVESWTGRWIGSEGTTLDIEPKGEAGAYTVKIHDLDAERSFDGKADGDTISFTRDGQNLKIRAGNGADTGMKWLADKKNCLVVAANEGYCRD